MEMSWESLREIISGSGLTAVVGALMGEGIVQLCWAINS